MIPRGSVVLGPTASYRQETSAHLHYSSMRFSLETSLDGDGLPPVAVVKSMDQN